MNHVLFWYSDAASSSTVRSSHKSRAVVAPTVFPSCADVYPRSKSPQVAARSEGTKLAPGLAGPTPAELRGGWNRPQLCVSKLSELSEQTGM